MTTSVTASFRAAVETAFQTAWLGAGFSAAGLNFANTEFNPQGQGIWASLSIKYGMGVETTMGNAGKGANQLVGVVFVQIFVPQGSGTGDMLGAADVVRDCFQRKRIGNGVFGAPSGATQAATDTENDAWQMIVVSCPFWLEDFL